MAASKHPYTPEEYERLHNYLVQGYRKPNFVFTETDLYPLFPNRSPDGIRAWIRRLKNTPYGNTMQFEAMCHEAKQKAVEQLREEVLHLEQTLPGHQGTPFILRYYG